MQELHLLLPSGITPGGAGRTELIEWQESNAGRSIPCKANACPLHSPAPALRETPLPRPGPDRLVQSPKCQARQARRGEETGGERGPPAQSRLLVAGLFDEVGIVVVSEPVHGGSRPGGVLAALLLFTPQIRALPAPPTPLPPALPPALSPPACCCVCAVRASEAGGRGGPGCFSSPTFAPPPYPIPLCSGDRNTFPLA